MESILRKYKQNINALLNTLKIYPVNYRQKQALDENWYVFMRIRVNDKRKSKKVAEFTKNGQLIQINRLKDHRAKVENVEFLKDLIKYNIENDPRFITVLIYGEKKALELYPSIFRVSSKSEDYVGVTVKEAFNEVFKEKVNDGMSEGYIRDLNSVMNRFLDFLGNTKDDDVSVLDKKLFVDFLDDIGKDISAVSYNNRKGELNVFVKKFVSKEYLKSNFIATIDNKTEKKKAKEKIADIEFEKAIQILEKTDTTLLMYVKLISFMFWRPIETTRIKISDIDFKKRLMIVDTKGKDLKTKIIPEYILEDLERYVDEREGMLFELTAKQDKDKAGTLTKRFRSMRIKNSLDENLTPYRFRYYYITKLYLLFRKTMSKKKSIEKLSLITGHESNAILKYITVNDVELPKDYSKFLKEVE